MGIKTDIGLVNDDYQWLCSMFYFATLPIMRVSLVLVTDALQATSPGNILRIDSSSVSLWQSIPHSAS